MTTRRWPIIAVAALLLPAWDAFSQATLLTLVTNGSRATRLNIVFLSEGYTTNDLDHFPADAQVMLDRMLSTPPMDEYSNYFNAFAIAVPSNESGSDHLTPTPISVDTYFNSTYDSYGIQRLITTDSTGSSRANSLLATFVPDYDVAAIVVNDPQYGGSGGNILISSVHEQSPEIATHEFGHTFANLGDEYEYAGSTPSEKPNTTSKTNLAAIKWFRWIPPGTPLPTPPEPDYFNVIGLFRGAAYSTNYFRPKYDCKMRALGVPFCEICGEAFVKSIYNRITTIESFSPANTNVLVRLTNDLSRTFSITKFSPTSHPLLVQWYTNNVPVLDGTSTVFTVSGFALPPANTNQVRVDVIDPTPMVLTPSTNMMTKSVTWRTGFVAEQPLLSFTNDLSGTSLSWPVTAAGFYLEQADSLTGTNAWTPLLLISNQIGFTVDLTNAESYFRLHHP